MTHSLSLLGVVALLHFATSDAAEPHVQISASGAVLAEPHRHVHKAAVSPWMTDIVKKVKEGAAHTHHGASTLMRSEVRRHLPEKLARARFVDEAMGLLEAGQVNCSTSTAETDPTGKLCRVLHGTNLEVAGKLERAVKGLSLRPKTANATEMVVADKDEDRELIHLKAAMWDMWFCAKRANPPCDIMTSDEPKIKAAREQAFNALHAIHAHASPEVPGANGPADDTLAASTPPAAAVAAVEGSLLEQTDIPADAGEPTVVSTSTKWAQDTLDMILAEPNVTGKLWDAIHMVDVDIAEEDFMVKLTDDEDGNMKKLKANLLLLHECASMPDCATPPVSGCCSPKSPTQAQYVQARNDAYIAYHDIGESDHAAKRAYTDILKNVGNTPPGSRYMPDQDIHLNNGTVTTVTIYPPGHPLHGTEGFPHNSSHHNSTKAVPAVVVADSGGTLMMAIVMVTVVVLLAVAFLMFKTNQMDGGGGGGAKAGGENWGGEGYGEGEGGW